MNSWYIVSIACSCLAVGSGLGWASGKANEEAPAVVTVVLSCIVAFISVIAATV